MKLTILDKVCAGLAFALGVLLLLQGIGGVYWPATFQFELPPGAALLLLPVGWGIVRSVVVAWSHSRTRGHSTTSENDRSETAA